MNKASISVNMISKGNILKPFPVKTDSAVNFVICTSPNTDPDNKDALHD